MSTEAASEHLKQLYPVLAGRIDNAVGLIQAGKVWENYLLGDDIIAVVESQTHQGFDYNVRLIEGNFRCECRGGCFPHRVGMCTHVLAAIMNDWGTSILSAKS